jgi:uncharacterized protein YkuJ
MPSPLSVFVFIQIRANVHGTTDDASHGEPITEPFKRNGGKIASDQFFNQPKENLFAVVAFSKEDKVSLKL